MSTSDIVKAETRRILAGLLRTNLNAVEDAKAQPREAAWRVAPGPGVSLRLEHFVHALGYLYWAFIRPDEEPNEVTEHRRTIASRKRAIRESLVSSSSAVWKLPQEFANTIDPADQSLGTDEQLAEWIAARCIQPDCCVYCHQPFSIADYERPQLNDEDIGVVHTYCHNLIYNGKLICCPREVGSGTGRNMSLGGNCLYDKCRVRQAGRKIGEQVARLFMPLELIPLYEPQVRLSASNAARYIDTLGSHGQFDAVDIALDICNLGYKALLLDTRRIKISRDRTISAYQDPSYGIFSYGIASRDIATGLYELVTGEPYEPKTQGSGFSMQSLQRALLSLAAKQGT